MKQLFHTGMLILSATGLTVIFLLIILIANRPFNSWLLMQVVEQVPELNIDRIDGLLLGELHLSGLSYQTDEITVSAKSLSYQYRWLDLFAARIRFESIQLSDVEVLLHGADESNSEPGSMDFMMPLALLVDDFTLQNISIKQQQSNYLVESVSLTLYYEGQQVQLDRFALHSDIVQLKGKVEVQVKDRFPFKVDLGVSRSSPELADVSAQVSAYGDSQKIYLDSQLLTPNAAHAQGWVDLSETSPSFDLLLEWTALQWPLQGEKQYASENARLTLQGSLEQYFVTLNTSVSARDLPSGLVLLEGEGNAEQLTLKTLAFKSPSGTIQSTGRISWTASIPSEIQLQAQQIQLASLLPAYPGELSLDAQVSGDLFNKPDFLVNIENLYGNVLDNKLQGKADLHYSTQQTSIQQLQASIGSNVVAVQGKLGATNALTFKLDAQNLHELSPDLTGSLFAQGSLKGDIATPAVKFKLESTGLSFQDQQLASLQSSGTLDTSGKGRLDMQLIARKLVVNGQKIEKIELHSVGQNAHHELRAQLFSDQANLELAMQGEWEPAAKEWRGQFKKIQIQSGSIGFWRMIKASPFNLALADQPVVQIATYFCLAQKNGTGLLCLDVQSEAAGHKLTGTIQQLPLSVFADWMPATVKVNSLLQSQFSFSLQEVLQGDVQLSVDPGVVIVQDEELDVQRLDFKEAHFFAQFLADTMQSSLSVVIDDTNQLKGQVEVQGLTHRASAIINGLLKVQLDKTSFISAFADSVSNVAGNINGEVYIQGLLKSPSLNKSWLKLQQTSLTVVDAGLSVRDLNLELTHAETKQIFVHGNADIEGKSLLLNGQIDDYSNDKMHFKLLINGQDLPLLQLPELQAWLSPDLQLTGNKQGARLTGEVQVPKAIMVFQTLPEGTVQPSADEVIVGDKKRIVKLPVYPVDMDVLIKLGKAVSIQGFGLQTRLEGSLRAKQENNHLKLFNELNFLEGTYAAYGQDLKIEKGRFLFAGDIENPGISILASRKASDWDDKTIAYLSMTGTLKKPVTRIYTEPALNDSEALAYLLTGAPLDKGDSDSAGLIAKAALSLGREYVDAVMGTVGVDEFDIKSTQLGQNSMIVGKRITPSLYARYIMDILTTQMQFAVEYKLTEHISIETRAGSTHSSDIKYSIEFD